MVRQSTPRCDTPRNQEFITTSLSWIINVLQTINTHSNPEAYCKELNATSSTDDPLYYDFQFVGCARVSMSSKTLRERWGRVAVAIWEKLFTRVVRGGHARDFVSNIGVTFNSVWELNVTNWRAVTLKGIKSLSSGQLKPSELLSIIEQLDSIVVATTEWANTRSILDSRHVVTVPVKRERVTREKAKHLSATVRKAKAADAWEQTKENYADEKDVGQYRMG